MQQRRPGFSLMELVFVLVMAAILLGIGVSKVDVTRFRVNSAIQVLGTTMLTAQRQAVTQQHDVIVFFDTAYKRLQILEDRNNNGAADATEHMRAVPLGELIVFGRGAAPAMSFGTAPVSIVKQIGGRPALVFHRDGSASEVGGFYITSLRALRGGDRPDDARAVRIDRATGRASYFRYRADGWQKIF
jgi:prepilin-type N-terminal cleavage/methylation domain-containing protein